MPYVRTHHKLGEILTQEGRLSTLQLRTLLREQAGIATSRAERPRLGELLIRHRLLDEEDLARVLARQYRCRYLEPAPENVKPHLFTDIPLDIVKSYRFAPLGRDEQTLTIAVADFAEADLPDLLGSITGLAVGTCVTTGERLDALRSAYIATAAGMKTPVEVVRQAPRADRRPPGARGRNPARTRFDSSPSPLAPHVSPPGARRPAPALHASPSGAGEPVEVPYPKAVDHLLHRLLETSVREQYLNVAFTPGESSVQVMARRAGGRTDQTRISFEARQRIRRGLATILGIEEAGIQAPMRRKIRWKHEHGVAVFEIVLFPSSSPQLDINLLSPREKDWTLEDAGIGPAALPLLSGYLSGRSGLVVLGNRTAGAAWRSWVALLSDLVARGRKVLSFEGRILQEIPGVFQHGLDGLQDRGRALFAQSALDAMAGTQADVLALRTDELPPQLADVVEVARGQAMLVVNLASASPLAALRRMEQVTRAPITDGLFLNAYKMSRLCPFCREGFPITADGLPRGYRALAGKIAYRASGCDTCRSTGHFGAVHLYEVLRLDGERLDRDGIDFYSRPLKEYLLEEGLLVPVLPGARRAMLNGTIGLDDYLSLAHRD